MKRRTFLQLLGLGAVSGKAVADIADPTDKDIAPHKEPDVVVADGFTFLESDTGYYFYNDLSGYCFSRYR